jgi:hypothetical protein
LRRQANAVSKAPSAPLGPERSKLHTRRGIRVTAGS